MSTKRKNRVGLYFGQLLVLEDLGKQSCEYKYRCICTGCGRKRIVSTSNLASVSCMKCSREKQYGTLEERLLKNSIPEPNSGCWLWMAGLQHYDVPVSYGSTSINGKKISAHRASFLCYKGKIPNKMLVCHTCDNPACINPDHLFLGTALENMRDRDTKGRRTPLRGIQRKTAKLNDDAVREIRLAKESQNKLAKKFGVDQALISGVQLRKVWTHVK